jgi:16S rRNA G527 N7-methylase RsmG
LADLVALAFPLLVDGGRLVAWKRGDMTAEIKAATLAAMPLGGARITIRSIAVPGLEGHILVVIEKPAVRGGRASRGPRMRC